MLLSVTTFADDFKIAKQCVMHCPSSLLPKSVGRFIFRSFFSPLFNLVSVNGSETKNEQFYGEWSFAVSSLMGLHASKCENNMPSTVDSQQYQP